MKIDSFQKIKDTKSLNDIIFAFANDQESEWLFHHGGKLADKIIEAGFTNPNADWNKK